MVGFEYGFWNAYQKLIAKEAIPYQWKALNDELPQTKPSGALRNFRIAAGYEIGKFRGRVFQDSDLYKWLEGAAYTLNIFRDKTLEKQMDAAIKLIGEAQCEDGYINTYYQIEGGLENKWTNLRDCHELYCGGHLIEAGVACYKYAGKTELLEIAIRFADCMARTFGKEQGKIAGYPGHPEVEWALVRLYKVTGNQSYLELADFFVRERGRHPNYFEQEALKYGNPQFKHKSFSYNQSDMPLMEQEEIKGHAVRAMYFMTAATALADLEKDAQLMQTVKRLWKDMVSCKLYLTGGIGASAPDEAFSGRYDLPNAVAYNETCASVGLVFWASQMMEMSPESIYGDVMEKVLYNSALAGMALDGKSFFYVNPLQVDDEITLARRDHEHVSNVRQKWFNTACCPPNIVRLIQSLGQYFYTEKEEELYVNLYGESKGNLMLHGEKITIIQHTEYPWKGKIQFQIQANEVRGKIYFRIPAWADEFEIYLNNRKTEYTLKNGFAMLEKCWEMTDTVTLEIPMKPKKIYASGKVREDVNKVAVSRGPLIYAIESVDNGEKITTFGLRGENITETMNDELLEGAVYLNLPGYYLPQEDALLYSYDKPGEIPCIVTAIPYFMWQNRGTGEMRVWFYDKTDK